MMHQMITFEVRREGADVAKAALTTYADEVRRKEGGTAFFHAYQEDSTPTRFVILVAFRVASAVSYHEGTAWAKKFREALAPHLTGPLQMRALAPLAA